MTGSRLRARAWIVVLVLGAAMLAGRLAVPGSGLGYDLWYQSFALVSVLGVTLGVLLHRPASRLPWIVMIGGHALTFCGEFVYILASVRGTEVAVPGIADVFYLGAYPLYLLSLALLVRRQSAARSPSALIDTAIVTVGVAAVAWATLIEPYFHEPSLTTAELAVSVAYPVADLLVVAMLARVAMSASWRLPAIRLLGAGFLVNLIGNALYGVGSPRGWYEAGGAIDLTWCIAYVLWAAAALHPSMATLTLPRPAEERPVGKVRFTILPVTGMLAPAVMAVGSLSSSPMTVAAAAVASVITVGLVTVRLSDIVRRNTRLVSREQVLRRAAAELLTAADRQEVAAAGAAAALALASRASRWAALEIVAPTGEPIVVVRDAATGETATDGAADRVAAARRGLRDDVEPIAIVHGDEVFGTIALHAPGGMGEATRGAITTLALQLALSLERIELTEDLVARQSTERFRTLVQHSADAILIVDERMTIRYHTPSTDPMLGFGDGALIGRPVEAILARESGGEVMSLLDEAIGRPGATLRREGVLRRRDGQRRTVEMTVTNLLDDPNAGGLVVTAHDVTDRKHLEEQLAHQAFHDPLTGLANRELFRDRVTHALSRASRAAAPPAVAFIDLDDFKAVNDSMGHHVGDELLRQVADRLRSSLRSSDTIARLGGDEFALLLEDTPIGHVERIAENLIALLSRPYDIGRPVVTEASIGLAVAAAGQSADALLRDADAAMYRAKGDGKATYRLFDPSLRADATDRLLVRSELQHAVQTGAFALDFQPILDVREGTPAVCESLVRWIHPDRGRIAPSEFIAVAEETGLIVPIGRWVLETACETAVGWRRLTDRPPAVSVNVSTRQLQEHAFIADVAEVLTRTGLPADRLVLEITETVLVEGGPDIIRRLSDLRAAGVRIALDDFGTGYSSLAYLQTLPVDILKIAKPFVEPAGSDSAPTRLLSAIVQLGATLELTVVAEGVETAEQLARLTEMECHLAQGFFLARPMDREAVGALIARRMGPLAVAAPAGVLTLAAPASA